MPNGTGIPLNEETRSPLRTVASNRNSSSSTTTVVTDPFTASTVRETANVDAFIQDAFSEEEDNVEPAPETPNNNTEQAQIPNNDFCFTEDDFVRVRQEHNDATRHQGIYNDTWDKIQELVGHEEVCTNLADGSVTWKVVPNVYDDELKDVRKHEEYLFSDVKYNTFKNDTYGWDYNKSFWALWPSTINNDVLLLEEVI